MFSVLPDYDSCTFGVLGEEVPGTAWQDFCIIVINLWQTDSLSLAAIAAAQSGRWGDDQTTDADRVNAIIDCPPYGIYGADYDGFMTAICDLYGIDRNG